MRKGKKVYKKFLSCVLAAAMAVTSGVVYPGNGKTVAALQKVNFTDGWNIDADQAGVILDKQGVMYQLNEDGTATVLKFNYLYRESVEGDPIERGIVEIPDTVPINLTNYKDYLENGTLNATSMVSSQVTVIEANAFFESSDITVVTVPEHVTSIGDNAFASCTNLTELHWEVPAGETGLQIGGSILANSPNCKVYSDNDEVIDYVNKNGYSSGEEEDGQDSPSPTASETPDNDPTATPSAEPTVTVTPGTESTVSPSTEPTVSPSAAPIVPPSTAPAATPIAPTSTPKVTVYPTSPVIPSTAPATSTPVVVTPPAEQTPAPGETAAPTAAPTAAVNTSAPASQAPEVSEVPEPAVTENPSDSTPAPVQPTVAPTQEETIVKNNVTYEIDTNSKSVSVSDMKEVKTSLVTIPATVKVNGVSYPVISIDKGAFRNNTTIQKVELGKNVTSIGAGAFRGCVKLTSIQLPSKLQTIKKNSFNGCSSLKSIEIPKTLKKIGKAAFKDCTSMKSVSVGNDPTTKAGGLSLDGKQVRYGASTVTINIGKKAFENCKKLNKVIINALVKIIGKSAFKDCKSLRSVLIYSKVLKQVKGGALTGVSNCTISVPSKKVEPYKILFKNKGQGKKVVVAKF